LQTNRYSDYWNLPLRQISTTLRILLSDYKQESWLTNVPLYIVGEYLRLPNQIFVLHLQNFFNMDTSFTTILKQIVASLFLACLCTFVHAQTTIDINSTTFDNLRAQESDNVFIRDMFKDADRYRPFDYNKDLVSLRSSNIGDTLLLNFFDDRQYKSVIQNVAINYNGRISITSKIAGAEFAYCYMVVSSATISISAELPIEDAYFFASVKNGQAYMAQVKKSKLDKTALEGADPIMNLPNLSTQSREVRSNKGIDDPVFIDLLMVYTPAAYQWALDDWRVTDIFDLIDQALQRSNISMENSETGVTFRIAYIHLTDYIEDNTIEDLYRITDPWDGYMDEVHELRDIYYADEIVFIPKIDFTGGVAWLLNNENGFDPDYFAVALSRVQQSSWTYTVVHEIGHNMGCHHHAGQNFQPGPGLFEYSSGWRGVINGEFLCSVMTYEAGVYFADGQDHVRIPYFSSPDVFYEGEPLGDGLTNNTLTIKRTKTAISNYRVSPYSCLPVTKMTVNYTSDCKAEISWEAPSGKSMIFGIQTAKNDDFSYNIYRDAVLIKSNITETFYLDEGFDATKKHTWSVSVICPEGDESQQISVTKNNCQPPTYTIIATATEHGNIEPSGTVIVKEGENKTFTFTPNTGYAIADVLVNGISNQGAITNGFYTFTNVKKNHTIHVSFDLVDIRENEFENVKIYARLNSIFIQNKGNVSLKSVEIFDILGRIIYQGNITNETTVITLQAESGIYNIRLASEKNTTFTTKILMMKY